MLLLLRLALLSACLLQARASLALRSLQADDNATDGNATDDNVTDVGEIDVNETNVTAVPASTSPQPLSITSGEISGMVFVACAFLAAVHAHSLLLPAGYKIELIYTSLVHRFKEETFSKWAPLLQWMIVTQIFMPFIFILIAALQVMDEQWRVAALGSLIALSLYVGSLGVGRLHADSFIYSRVSALLLVVCVLMLSGFFFMFIWVIPPFSFIGTFVVISSLSAVPSIILAFLTGPWQSTSAYLKVLTGEKAAVGDASALPRVKWKSMMLIAVLVVASLGLLGSAGAAIYVLHPDDRRQEVGFVIAMGLVVLDALVWHLWRLGLVTGAAQSAWLMMAARVMACVWGEEYWLIGHSGVFLFMLILVLHITSDLVLPSPDSPALRRQKLAGEMLDALLKQVTKEKGDAAEPGDADDDAKLTISKTTASLVAPKKLPSYLHPGWILPVLVAFFVAEVVVVSVFFKGLPDIAICDSCTARKQPYYAGIAIAAALTYGIALFGYRYASIRSAGMDGSLLENAPASLVLAYVCFIVLGAYTSWVLDSWQVVAHTSFLPLIIGFYFSGFNKWVEDDFSLYPKKRSSSSVTTSASVVKVAPAPEEPGGADSGDEPAKAGGDEAKPEIGESAPAGDKAATGDPAAPASDDTNPAAGQRSWTLHFFAASLLLDIVYAGTLHAIEAESLRWTGWTISAALFVIGMTFLSNRLWFGTYRLYPEQPVMWSVIGAVLLLWAGLVEVFQNNSAVNYFAFILLMVVLLYPAAYALLLATQVLRDEQWAPKDEPTKRFVRNSFIFSSFIYVVFCSIICIFDWAVAVCGYALLVMALLLGFSVWKWVNNNHYVPPKVQMATAAGLLLCMVGAATGVTYYFQSILAGFSVLCAGLVLLLALAGIQYYGESRQLPALQKMRVGAGDTGFPMYQMIGGDLKESQRDVISALAALSVIAVWGCSAAAAVSEWNGLGMVVGVLGIMAIFIMLADNISAGGARRAKMMVKITEDDIIAAAQEVLELGFAEPKISSSVKAPSDAAADPSGGSAGAPAVGTTKTSRSDLVKMVQKFDATCKLTIDRHLDQIKKSCCGRFNPVPCVSLWYTLCNICKCVQDTSPEKPHEEQMALKKTAAEALAALVQRQAFSVRIRYLIYANEAQRLWAKESEFRAFLQSTTAGSKGFTLDDFNKLPRSDREKIEAAWQKWKTKEASKADDEEKKRKEEEEAARKRKEEEARKWELAKQELQKALDENGGSVGSWQGVIAKAKMAGLSNADDVFAKAVARLVELDDAEYALDEALGVTGAAKLAALQEAVAEAKAVGLASDLLSKATDEITAIQGVMDAGAEAEAKRKEAERIKALEEEKRKKKQQDEEKRKKEEEERLKSGEPPVVEANLEKLIKEAARGNFTDTEFESMGEKVSKYQMSRLSELNKGKKVEFQVNGMNPGDINQGELGDCWFLSAIACVATRPALTEKLFRYTDSEKGLYVVRFYKSGVYQDVAIDDYFPTKYGHMAFASSSVDNEAWVQVLEKAYAKLHGSYDAIEGGFVNDGLVDMTGGIGDQIRFDSKEAKAKISDGSLFQEIKGLSQDGHLLGCGSSAGSDTDISSMGIVQGHAYSILRVEEVDGHQLLQVRNPWGSTEWKGKWSDGDKESWTQRMKVKLGYVDADDGSFWIAFEDFVIHYRNVYICRILQDGWHKRFVRAEWKGKTAGGCRNYDTYEDNPKIKLKIQGKMRMLLTLEQADPRGWGDGASEIAMGFKVFKQGSFSGNGLVGTSTYSYNRESCVEAELAENSEGPHVILPSSFKPGIERAFVMKVFWKGDPGAVSMWRDEED